MKHKISGIMVATFLLITILFTGGAVYAQDEGLPNPGITPDSPFYFMDKLGKTIGMAFTFGTESKSQKALQYAEERLAETQSMAGKNKVKQMEKAAGEYDKYMAMVQQRLEQATQAGQSDNISERVALATSNHLEVLARVREQVSERVREAIGNAENVSMNGQINALRALGENKPEKALDICDNITARQTERIRVRASANVTSDNETSANLTALLDYADRIAALEEELTQKAGSLGINITALQERMAHSTANRLEVLSVVYAKAPVQAQSAIANAIENSVTKYERALEKLGVKNMVSVNETMNALPDKIQDQIRASTSNRMQISTTNSSNQTQLKTTTETKEQKETEKPDKNTGNKP
jgi:hypothetical protein